MKSLMFVVGLLMFWSSGLTAGAEVANASTKTGPDPALKRGSEDSGTEARPRGPLMAWRAQGDKRAGFVRIELWAGTESDILELFVWSSTSGQASVKGYLVPMPEAAKRSEMAQIFVLAERDVIYGPMGAAILRDGTLRIYPMHGFPTMDTPELKPLSGAGLE